MLKIIKKTPVSEEKRDELLGWLQAFTFSREKILPHKFFSDGMMFVELVLAHFPKSLNQCSFQACIEKRRKMKNWEAINLKVFEKMGFTLHREILEALVQSDQQAIYTVLEIFHNYVESGVKPEKKSKLEQRIGERGEFHNKVKVRKNHILKKAYELASSETQRLEKEEELIQLDQKLDELRRHMAQLLKDIEEKDEQIEQLESQVAELETE